MIQRAMRAYIGPHGEVVRPKEAVRKQFARLIRCNFRVRPEVTRVLTADCRGRMVVAVKAEPKQYQYSLLTK